MDIRETNELLVSLVERVEPAVAERRKRKIIRQVKDALALRGRVKDKYVIRKLKDAKKAIENLMDTTGLVTPPIPEFYEKIRTALAVLR